MPRPLLYANFEDSKYTSQFVGSIHPELKEAQQVLNQTYDAAKETDSKLESVARETAQKAHPLDQKAANDLYANIKTKLGDRLQKGDYENMLHETTNDARQYSVNASKILENKKLIDEAYAKHMNDPKIRADAKQSTWDNMIMRGQKGLAFDPNNQLVTGNMFKGKDIAEDYSHVDEALKIGSLFKADVIAGKHGNYGVYVPGNNGEFKKTNNPDAPEARLMHITSGNKLETVDPAEIKTTLKKYFEANPKENQYVDREIQRQVNPILDKIDQADISPQEKAFQKSQVISAYKNKLDQEEINPALDVAASVFGYSKKENEDNIQFDASLNKAASGSGKKELTPTELQTLDGIQTNNPHFKDKKYNFNEGSYDNPDYLSQIKHKFSVDGKQISAIELQNKYDAFKNNINNKNKSNPYELARVGMIRRAGIEGVLTKIEDPIKNLEKHYSSDPLVKGVVDHLNIDLKNYKNSTLKDKKIIAEQIQKAVESKSQTLKTLSNPVKLFDPTLKKQVNDYLQGYFPSTSYADPNTGERVPMSELIKKELDIDVNNVDDMVDPKKLEKLKLAIHSQGFSQPDGSNGIYKTKVGTKTVNVIGSQEQQQEFDEINRIAKTINSGNNSHLDVNFTDRVNGFNLNGKVVPQDHWSKQDPTKYEKRDAVIVLNADTYIENVGTLKKGEAISYATLIDLQRLASRTLNPTRRNKQSLNGDIYQKPDINSESNQAPVSNTEEPQ